MSTESQTSAEEPTEAQLLRAQVRRLCRDVPRGRVISYGALGARCEPPISGYVCGRVMGQLMDDVAWWRVVGKAGTLPIGKRGPQHALQQRALLEDEGVRFESDAIKREFFEDFEDEPTSAAPTQGELF